LRRWAGLLLLAALALLLSCAPAGAVTSGIGTLVNNGDQVALGGTRGFANCTLSLGGTWTGTVQFEGTIDSTTWFSVLGTVLGGTTTATSATANGQWGISNAIRDVRGRASAPMTGTATVNLYCSEFGGGGGGGGGAAGSVTQGTVPWTVAPDGTSWAKTGTSANVAVTAAIPTGANSIGTVVLGAGSANAGFIGLIDSAGVNKLAINGTGQIACSNCVSSGGSSQTDQGAFTEGTTTFTVMGGEYKTSPTSLASGTAGAVLLTAGRAMTVAGVDTTAASQAIASGSGNTSTFPNGPAPSGLIAAGENGVAFTLASGGTLIATLTPQCSTDGGTTYPVNGSFVDPVAGTFTATTVIASGQAQTVFQVICPQGTSHVQLKATAFTSGTANFTGRGTALAWPTVYFPVVSSPSGYSSGTINTPSLTTSGAFRTNDSASSATGVAPPAQAVYIGGLQSGATGGFLGGVTVCDLDAVVNISTATTTLIVTGVSGRQVRLCSFHLSNNAADNVAWIEGTGATCGTGTAGMAGGTTAASGYNLLANGGLAIGSGFGEVMRTATTGDSVCLVTSAATQLSGHAKYTIY